MDDDVRLRLEYQQSVTAFSGLTEIRFKLLALVPTVAGAVVALVPAQSGGSSYLQSASSASWQRRVCSSTSSAIARSERRPVSAWCSQSASSSRADPIANVPPRRALGIGLTHTLAVAMVYGAALGGWVYLVVWGALRAFGVGHDARTAGLAAGVVAAILVALLVERLESSAW